MAQRSESLDDSISQIQCAEDGDSNIELNANTQHGHHHHMLHEQQQLPQTLQQNDLKLKQKKFAQQRSILKNSQECNREEIEQLEAKKQIILRRRRLFSHYRQYEQWRRRQFSYDPCYYRANPLPIGQAACSDYLNYGGGGGSVGGAGGAGSAAGAGAFRRRRQYRRQYSCAERSREGSRESRESSSLQRYPSIMASGTFNTDTTAIVNTYNNQNNNNQHNYISNSNPHNNNNNMRSTSGSASASASVSRDAAGSSFGSSDCGALAYQPLHCSSRHFHLMQEEHSSAIAERCTRSRINSAIFVSSEGRGFDSIEFLRRHGSQSVLCRKARSAENITEDERKKSFSEKRQWQTEEAEKRNEARNRGELGIELKECQPSGALAVLKTNAEQLAATVLGAGLLGHSAAVTTSNGIVGSISIEATPAHLKDDETKSPLLAVGNSSSHDSNDTVEELIQIPAESRSRSVLTHQRSSTASSSPHGSPKSLSLTGLKARVGTLPVVSVSGPSPQQEHPPGTDCL